MRQQNDKFRALFPRLIDDFLHPLFANAETQIWEHPTGIGNWQIRKCLTDHGNLDAVLLEHFYRFKRRFIPFFIEHIRAKERERQVFDHLANILAAIRELPMRCHGIGLERVHDRNHVLALRLVRRITALPRISTIQQQRVRAIRTNTVHNRSHSIDTTHAPVILSKRRKIR